MLQKRRAVVDVDVNSADAHRSAMSVFEGQGLNMISVKDFAIAKAKAAKASSSKASSNGGREDLSASLRASLINLHKRYTSRVFFLHNFQFPGRSDK